jgi:hypothetical protein
MYIWYSLCFTLFSLFVFKSSKFELCALGYSKLLSLLNFSPTHLRKIWFLLNFEPPHEAIIWISLNGYSQVLKFTFNMNPKTKLSRPCFLWSTYTNTSIPNYRWYFEKMKVIQRNYMYLCQTPTLLGRPLFMSSIWIVGVT